MTLYTGSVCPDPSYVHTPLIEIWPVSDDSALRQAASRLNSYDYLLFTSRYAVEAIGRCDATASQHRGRARVVSIGRKTTEALKKGGFIDIEQVERDNSYGVIEWFENELRARARRGESLHGRVLIPRSNLALDLIPDGLRSLGFEVTTVTAYENRFPEHPKVTDLGEIDKIIFTSPSTIDHFIRLYGRLPEGKQIITRGPITKQHLETIIKEQNI